MIQASVLMSRLFCPNLCFHIVWAFLTTEKHKKLNNIKAVIILELFMGISQKSSLFFFEIQFYHWVKLCWKLTTDIFRLIFTPVKGVDKFGSFETSISRKKKANIDHLLTLSFTILKKYIGVLTLDTSFKDSLLY